MLDLLRNRKKVILGAIAYALIYVLARVVLDQDEATAHTTAAAGSLIVIERAGPIFGIDVAGPKVETKPSGDKVVVIEAQGTEQVVARKRRR